MTDDAMVSPAIEAYAEAHTTPAPRNVVALGAETRAAMPSPQMMSALVESRLLEALVVATRARRVLEVGTFTGAGALAMAARLPPDGRVITIERDEDVAAIARRHIQASPEAAKIELLIGDARELVERVDGPFDLVFIDAWKGDYAHYYERALPKLAEHGMILADNVLWSGKVLHEEGTDPSTAALKAFADQVQDDPRVHNAMLTVGDGLLLIRRAPGAPRSP